MERRQLESHLLERGGYDSELPTSKNGQTLLTEHWKHLQIILSDILLITSHLCFYCGIPWQQRPLPSHEGELLTTHASEVLTLKRRSRKC